MTALLAAARDDGVERDGVEVVTFGEPLVVLLAEAGVPLAAAVRFTRTVAGSEVNVAVGLARAGHRVEFLGRVGSDAFGEVVLRLLRGEGVGTAALRVDADAATGLLVRDAHAERAVEVLYYRAGSASSRHCTADLDLADMAGARLVYASGITPLLSASCAEVTAAALSSARAAGTTVAFDPNLRRRLLAGRDPACLLPYAACADLVLTGLDEGQAITGTRGPRAVADAFLARGARLVVIKQGRAGVWASDGTDTWEHRPPSAAVLDPVGAGDAFNAGFLSALLTGGDVAVALERGARLGRLTVQVVGDIEGLPTDRQPAGSDTGPDVMR